MEEYDKMFQEILNEEFKRFRVVEPRYHYWRYKNRYFAYTTEKTLHKGKQRYVAFVRKELISKRTKKHRIYKIVKKVGFAKRKSAKARAYKWYQNWIKHKESV